MAWKLGQNKHGQTAWICSEYSDLQTGNINDLAQYGQPFNPYEPGFDHNFVPDYKNVIVMMPQREVMFKGYGQLVKPKDFPVVKKFLNGGIRPKTDGAYSFAQLLALKLVDKKDRIISAQLYGGSSVPVSPGTISGSDAAYVHGSVGFALMSNTMFYVQGKTFTVRAEIGAMDDNWNFESSNMVAKLANPLVAALFGPDHNNLEVRKGETEAKIFIEFFGPGKILSETNTIK